MIVSLDLSRDFRIIYDFTENAKIWAKTDTSGEFRGGGGESATHRPPPLGDGLKPSLTVMLANANYDRSTVKHGTQNIQNDCHQWLSGRFRVHQIRFRPGLNPGPHWGS